MLNTIIDCVKIYKDVTLVTIDGVNPEQLSRTMIFNAIKEKKINLDMISQTPHLGRTITISFSVPDEHLTDVFEILARFRKQFPDIRTDVSSGCFVVSLSSPRMVDTAGVAADVFSAFDNTGVPVLLITTSDVSISCLFSQSSEMIIMSTLKSEGLL